jgi:hypothetical protein
MNVERGNAIVFVNLSKYYKALKVSVDTIKCLMVLQETLLPPNGQRSPNGYRTQVYVTYRIWLIKRPRQRNLPGEKYKLCAVD